MGGDQPFAPAQCGIMGLRFCQSRAGAVPCLTGIIQRGGSGGEIGLRGGQGLRQRGPFGLRRVFPRVGTSAARFRLGEPVRQVLQPRQPGCGAAGLQLPLRQQLRCASRGFQTLFEIGALHRMLIVVKVAAQRRQLAADLIEIGEGRFPRLLAARQTDELLPGKCGQHRARASPGPS